MTRKSKARHGLRRTYKINPTVKALRHALAIGLLAGSMSVLEAATPISDPTDVSQVSLDPESLALAYRDVLLDYSAPGDISSANGAVLNAAATNIAVGILVDAYSGYASVDNLGGIETTALDLYGPDNVLASGIYAWGLNGSEVTNDGTIAVSAGASGYGDAFAVGIASLSEGDVSVASSADITVVAGHKDIGLAALFPSYADAIAIDAISFGDYGAATVNNSANLTVSANNDQWYGASSATGISAEAALGAAVTNYGDIDITGTSGDGYAYTRLYEAPYTRYFIAGSFAGTGIEASAGNGLTSVINHGDITVVDGNPGSGFVGGASAYGAPGDYLTGISAENTLGDSHVQNYGDILIDGGERGIGIYAKTTFELERLPCLPPYQNYFCYAQYTGGGDAMVENTGDITIASGIDQEYYRFRAWAAGIAAITSVGGGNASIVNSGDLVITDTGTGGALGLYAGSYAYTNTGTSSVDNSGDLTIIGPEFAQGIYARSKNGVDIINSGDIRAYSEVKEAVGIIASTGFSSPGAISIINSGDITADGGESSQGIRAFGNSNDVSIINSGDISTSTTTYTLFTSYDYYYRNPTVEVLGGFSTGIVGFTFVGDVDLANTGDIHVDAASGATGIAANSFFDDASIVNSGDIEVIGRYMQAIGISSYGKGYEANIYYGLPGLSSVINSGDITATGHIDARGIQVRNFYGDVGIFSSGTVDVDAYYGQAIGIIGSTEFADVTIENSGDIRASGGYSAVGILADTAGYFPDGDYFRGNVSIENMGDIQVRSDEGRASGISGRSVLGDVSLYNTGNIDVATVGMSNGLFAFTEYGDITLVNVGSISAAASEEYAAGVSTSSAYGATVIINDGDIEASGTSLTQGVRAFSYDGDITIINYGNVTSTSDSGYSNAVATITDGFSAVYNFGLLEANGPHAWTINATGGALNLYNYGIVKGSVITDGGDDFIYNAADAQMVMSDDSILLGKGHNTFINAGELLINGDSNIIDMGSGGSTFGNYGSSIHMEDGAVDDVLAIIGNFTGDGAIVVDVDGATLTSDRLYIEGDVLPGTANAIDIELLSMPSAEDIAAGARIEILSVDGQAGAADFSIGSVNFGAEALFAVDPSIVRRGSDFALQFEVSGLSASGELLSSVSPAVQNMWFGTVGTLFQRQGGERRFAADLAMPSDAAAGTWVRVFSDNGTLHADANVGNFEAGGTRDIHFNNSGFELGAGYSFNDTVTVGLIGGRINGDLRVAAASGTDMNADTIGAYLTFTQNGFYADFSYRALDFSSTAILGATALEMDGKARGYSLEMGVDYRLDSGLQIGPQVQFSDMAVDFGNAGFASGDFQLTNGDASRLRAGFSIRKSYRQDAGLWTPYMSLSYVNLSSAANRYVIGGVLTGSNDISGSGGMLELGTDARYGRLLSSFGLVLSDGGAYDFVLGGQLNLRYSW